MSTADRHRVGVSAAHDTQHDAALQSGNPFLSGGGQLWVILLHRGGIDHRFRVLNILRLVLGIYRNPIGSDPLKSV